VPNRSKFGPVQRPRDRIPLRGFGQAGTVGLQVERVMMSPLRTRWPVTIRALMVSLATVR
jgi:hypothetical protein